jgi:hypothetical protein
MSDLLLHLTEAVGDRSGCQRGRKAEAHDTGGE